MVRLEARCRPRNAARMTTLVLGAAGSIGAPLVRTLLAGGQDVTAVSRAGGGFSGVAADRSDVAGLLALRAMPAGSQRYERANRAQYANSSNALLASPAQGPW